jgi:hypothetical protein
MSFPSLNSPRPASPFLKKTPTDKERKFTILPNFPHIIVILKAVKFPSNRLGKQSV